MEDGASLETGANAVRRVEAALRRAGEPAAIPLRQVVENVVLETTWRHKAATLNLVQVGTGSITSS